MTGQTRAPWTNVEMARLRRDYPVKSSKQLESAFPRHSLGSIRATARKHGIHRPKPVSKYLAYAARHHVPAFEFSTSIAACRLQAAERGSQCPSSR